MSDSYITPFFQPRGIVVIGASTSPEKLGYGVARNLIHSGYQGGIHFVGQKPGSLFGYPLYTEVTQVPQPADLAILIVPPSATPKTIEACGERGIRAAIIMSSGFREVGTEGMALEQECLEKARRVGIRLLGPNCIGTIDTYLPLDTTFLQPPMPAKGSIGFISQSGAFCAAVIDWARAQSFGFSRIISLGNQVDVNETDALAALAEEEHTRVIVLYMEAVSDGRRFVEVARAVTSQKPVVALKAGRYESGQKAAASHTGALAASDVAFEAAFEKAGILRADSAEQMFDWARALADCPSPYPTLHGSGEESPSPPGGIAILTNAGGPGVMATDALERNGLSLAKFREPTTKALLTALPAAASVSNPVDMLASATPDTYAACLKLLLQDEDTKGVLVILPPPPMFKAEEVAEKIVETADSKLSLSKTITKPIVVTLMGSTLVQKAAEIMAHSSVPVFPFPERAASALSALFRRADYLATKTRSDGNDNPHDEDRVPSLQSSPQELLSMYGIETAPIRLVHDLHEAKTIANDFGYPVVIKIASPDIQHKSDVGGVILDIQDPASLQIAYTQMLECVSNSRPEARIDGVYIQQQSRDGQEVIAGAVRDPQFGPLLMFGSGGVEVEGLQDVAFALAPLTPAEASKMIRKTWAGRKLAGFRGLPPADEESVVEVLVQLSRLMIDHDSILEIEINPLKVRRKGAIAIDVRMKSKD